MNRQWPYFLLVFLLPVAGVVWWWGVFAETRIVADQTCGPYHYAYLVQNGDFSKLPEAQQTALRELKHQKIATGAPITVLLTDPRTTARKEWTAQVGYLVEADAKVAEPLKLADIPARRVILAQVRAHPSLAPGKAYAALIAYLDAHGMKLVLPTVETYQGSELTVEMGN
ncbi:MAG: GyrI-like domain-containing protein [Sulfuricellaceae bacterium]